MKKKYYAAKNSDDNIRLRSSSGGIFLAVANYIVNNNGCVYGAVYNSNFEVVHIRAEKLSDIYMMTGSKYSKSDIGSTFKNVEKDLKSNKKVLFTGMPCQISALKKYLKYEYEQLITIDVVCHGTPKKIYLKDYLIFQEKAYHSKIKSINMRYKSEKEYNKNLSTKHIPNGNVEPHVMMIEFENGKKYKQKSEFDRFYQLFDYFISEGCFKCPFSNLNRLGDITIGDFHEFSSKLGDFNDGNGVSLLIVNTKKGEEIIKSIGKNLVLIEKREEECLQPAIQEPAHIPNNKEHFDEDYKKFGFEYVIKKYGKSGIKYNIKYFLNNIGILDKLRKIRGGIR